MKFTGEKCEQWLPPTKFENGSRCEVGATEVINGKHYCLVHARKKNKVLKKSR